MSSSSSSSSRQRSALSSSPSSSSWSFSSPYSHAAQLLNSIWTTHKSLKTLAYDAKTGSLGCSKATYAQVCHVLEHAHILKAVWNAAQEETERRKNVKNSGLLYVLLYELLMGPNQAIRGGGALKRRLLQREEELRKILRDLKEKDKNETTRKFGEISDKEGPGAALFPRYVRVNTLKTTLEKVVSVLQEKPPSSYRKNDDTHCRHRGLPSLYIDRHVPNLLVLPPGTDLHSYSDAARELLSKGHVVLQDKSSCFSALCLVHGSPAVGGDIADEVDDHVDDHVDNGVDKKNRNKKKNSCKENSNRGSPGHCQFFVPTSPIDRHTEGDDVRGSHGISSNSKNQQKCTVMDACAAPGNKTSHLAMLLAEVCVPSKRGEIGDDYFQDEKQHKKKNKNQTSETSLTATILACDRSSQRLQLLERRMKELIPVRNEGSSSLKSNMQPDKANPRQGNDSRGGFPENGKRGSSSVVAVQPILQDFLQTRPVDYPNLRAILLDPSCSGSGIFTSLDRQQPTQETTRPHDRTTTGAIQEQQQNERLRQLSQFQLRALKHAMSFPQVRRIVYSTCSLHVEENEAVVAQALREASGGTSDDAAVASNNSWELVPPACLQHWKRRGQSINNSHSSMSSFNSRVVDKSNMSKITNNGNEDSNVLTQEQLQCLIRADREDETNGFFVAYLERGQAAQNDDRKSKREKKEETKNKQIGQALADSSTTAPSPSPGLADALEVIGMTGNQRHLIVVPPGVSIYNGEFASLTSSSSSQQTRDDESRTCLMLSPPSAESRLMKEEACSSGDRHDDDNNEDKNSYNHDGGKKEKSGASAQEKAVSVSPSDTTEAASAQQELPVVLGKKRAKKLAWKRRQSEQRKERLGSSKRQKKS